ncbi:AAA family ATPase [Rhodopirellula sp. JC639]|uniref:AAA family ATPase n=1 Tax=Stieleria mannarensis TaxID=2755585 RepID=UPI001602BB1C|nr:AAA family ATPase [Rhodopirellula sp. JC639]
MKPHILIYRKDVLVDDELEKAFESVSSIKPIVNYRNEVHQVIETARAYQPAIVMLEIGPEMSSLQVLIDELGACSPHSAIVGLLQTDRVNAVGSESGLMIQALRLGVEDFIRRPISSRDLQQLLTRRLSPRRSDPAKIGLTVSFLSNKGGVGKSTAAVNVAAELARRHPGRVLLVDGSLQMGVCATQLNVQPKATLVDAWEQRDRLDERLLHELTTSHDSGLQLLAAPANAMEAAEIDDAMISRILLLARRRYDFVLVDTFPLFDRINMAILDMSDEAYVVLENVVPTMQIVRGFFDLLDEVDFPVDRQRVVLNRFSKTGGSPSRHDVERYLGRTVDHVVPYDKRIVQSANIGHPFVMSPNRFSKSARAIREMAGAIEQLRTGSTVMNAIGRVSSNGADVSATEDDRGAPT